MYYTFKRNALMAGIKEMEGTERQGMLIGQDGYHYKTGEFYRSWNDAVPAYGKAIRQELSTSEELREYVGNMFMKGILESVLGDERSNENQKPDGIRVIAQGFEWAEYGQQIVEYLEGIGFDIGFKTDQTSDSNGGIIETRFARLTDLEEYDPETIWENLSDIAFGLTLKIEDYHQGWGKQFPISEE